VVAVEQPVQTYQVMALLAVVLAAHMAEKTLFLMVKLDLQTQVAVAVVA
jgi:hypothetical protein